MAMQIATMRAAVESGEMPLSNAMLECPWIDELWYGDPPIFDRGLGAVVAVVHPLVRAYYETDDAYINNQEALEKGELAKIYYVEARLAAAQAETIAAMLAGEAAEVVSVAVYNSEADQAAMLVAKAAAIMANMPEECLIKAFFDALEAPQPSGNSE